MLVKTIRSVNCVLTYCRYIFIFLLLKSKKVSNVESLQWTTSYISNRQTVIKFLQRRVAYFVIYHLSSRITAIHQRETVLWYQAKSQTKVGGEPFGTFCWREGASTSLSLTYAQYAAISKSDPLFSSKSNTVIWKL